MDATQALQPAAIPHGAQGYGEEYEEVSSSIHEDEPRTEGEERDPPFVEAREGLVPGDNEP